jgi:hypothetical protein
VSHFSAIEVAYESDDEADYTKMDLVRKSLNSFKVLLMCLGAIVT